MAINWRLERSEIMVPEGFLSSRHSERESMLCLSPSSSWLVLGTLWRIDASHQCLPLSAHGTLPAWVSVSLFSLLLQDTRHIEFRAHPNRVWPHLNRLHLQRFHLKVTFTGSRWTWMFLGGLFMGHSIPFNYLFHVVYFDFLKFETENVLAYIHNYLLYFKK